MSGFNVAPYLAIPWKAHGRDAQGCDCWGLVRHVLHRECGLELPSFTEEYDDPSNVKATAAAYRLHTDELAYRITEAELQPFDAVLMRTAREPVHIGLISSPGYMLHMRQNYGAANVQFRSKTTEWSVIGFYRWMAMSPRRQMTSARQSPSAAR